jgi:hypothetical protein
MSLSKELYLCFDNKLIIVAAGRHSLPFNFLILDPKLCIMTAEAAHKNASGMVQKTVRTLSAPREKRIIYAKKYVIKISGKIQINIAEFRCNPVCQVFRKSIAAKKTTKE